MAEWRGEVNAQNRRLSYFVVDAELILSLLMNYPGVETSIPKDARIEWVEAEPPSGGGPHVGQPGRIRLVISSAKNAELPEGGSIPRFNPEFVHKTTVPSIPELP
jgi:hypothetical protein